MLNVVNMGLIPYSGHGVKRLSPKTGFVVTDFTPKRNLYEDGLVYISVINRPHDGVPPPPPPPNPHVFR